MRFYKHYSIVVSEDTLQAPKKIRFSETDQTVIDTEKVKEAASASIDLPAGATDFEIPMGAIGSGKWFFLMPTGDITLKIDNGTPLTLAGGFPCDVWTTYSSLKISTVLENRITYALAGE